MPIIWRYLITQYLKVFTLSVISFIAILLVTRVDEIAQFMAFGANAKLVLLFTVYQIPYILPIAAPISCLISSIILFQHLSHTHELTAFRACGMGLRQITAPILLTSIALSLGNFYVVSELATYSHLAQRQLLNELSSVNPLYLLQNKQLLKLKETYVDMETLRTGESAQNVLFIHNNKNNQRLNVMSIKKLKLDGPNLLGTGVGIFTGLDSQNSDGFDHLVVENLKSISTPANQFTQLIKKGGWRLNNDHLKMRYLLLRGEKEMDNLILAEREDMHPNHIAEIKKSINRYRSEISRRFSIAFAVFTFALMGAAFGIEISRTHSRKGTITVVVLAAFFLITFFTAKGFEHNFALATGLYAFPHIFIVALSQWMIKRASKGIE